MGNAVGAIGNRCCGGPGALVPPEDYLVRQAAERMVMLIDDARWILAAWRERILDDQDVRTWALEVIDSTSAPDIPEWLLDLCTLGATACMAKPSADFLYVPLLDFRSAFSLHVQACDFSNRTEVDALVVWISRACMGEDLDRPGVKLGYVLDHELNDCGRADWARDTLTKELPALRAQVAPIPDVVLRLVRQSASRSRGGDPSS
jgi:hypothetical protein